MSSNPQEYYIIFDTNTLYHTYDKKADFSSFSFSGTYENVVGFVNQLDIYERVVIVIPTVVWKEMQCHIIEAHEVKIKEFREKAVKHRFPEIEVRDTINFDYPEYICQVIKEYRRSLSSDINKVIEMPVASETRYQSIVKRAFDKQPPFEGRDKKSDKGFKDALLWESILEFVALHDTAKIIYYSKDNVFGEYLENEFSTAYPAASLTICSTENAVKDQLEIWAKEIDIYSFTPVNDYVEYKDVTDWLQSGDFLVQVIDRNYGIVEKSRLITNNTVHLISYDNIQITNQTDDDTEYSIDATLEFTYTLKDGSSTKECIDVCIVVCHFLNDVFVVEDVIMSDEVDNEASITE